MSDDLFNELESFTRDLDKKIPVPPPKKGSAPKKQEFTYDLDDGALE